MLYHVAKQMFPVIESFIYFSNQKLHQLIHPKIDKMRDFLILAFEKIKYR